MNVYILGIDHEIQLVDNNRPEADKEAFTKLLAELLIQQSVEFIGEETFPEKASIARTFEDVRSIRWAPIEMSVNARRELQIADEQATRCEPVFKDNMVVGSRPTRVLSDYIREEYMLWRTLTNAGDAKSILVLCGFMHSESLGKLFEREGHQVTVDSLCKRAWYSHPDCSERTDAARQD
jgi:hypothetical protein